MKNENKKIMKQENKEITDLEDLIKIIKIEIKELIAENEELKDNLNHLKSCKLFKPNTYWDEEKYDIFLKNHAQFTPIEFEKMFTTHKMICEAIKKLKNK